MFINDLVNDYVQGKITEREMSRDREYQSTGSLLKWLQQHGYCQSQEPRNSSRSLVDAAALALASRATIFPVSLAGNWTKSRADTVWTHTTTDVNNTCSGLSCNATMPAPGVRHVHIILLHMCIDMRKHNSILFIYSL